MTDHTPDDGLDALDFGATDEVADGEVDAFDFTSPGIDGDGGSDLDALATDPDAADDDVDELAQFTTTVTNPAETVSVSALIDGSVRHVTLAAKAADMTEAQLTDEILVLAHLAQQKGLAGQRDYLVDNELVLSGLGELGLDGREAMRDMAEGMGLPTTQQADAERAEVFAARYSTGHD